MITFLTSSPTGPLDGSRSVDGLDWKNYFIENLKKYWKEHARCLMIAAAPDGWEQNDEMVTFFGNAVKRVGLDWSVFDLLDSRNGQITREVLHTYDVIFLGGGHVPTQNRFFQELGLRKRMERYEGIVIGISAGTMNSADVVYCQPELEGEASDPVFARYLTGLNLTRTMILPHYQMVKDYWLDGQRLYEDITYGDSWGKRFLVLPDGSYLLIENGAETVWGEAWVISDGNLQKICEDGENVFFKK